ncbi:stalk domain-containing protein [Desulfoscipio gibsoniae]
MKRFLMFFSFVLFLAMLAINMPFIAAAPKAHADEQVDVYDQQKQLVKSVVFVVGSDRYFVDGQTPSISMDAKPFIESGRIFVPVRYLGNALGVDNDNIEWESPRATFKQPDMPVVELAVGSKVIKSDGAATTMDTAPLLKTGRTYLPARFVAEALGYEVAWDAANGVVLCWPKGGEKPDVSDVIDYIGGQPVEEPVETPAVPEGNTKELYDKAKPLDGEAFSFAGWNFDPGVQKSLQDFWDLSGYKPVIQSITVDDLKPNGIKMDGQIIHDLQVTKGGVTVTATTSGKAMPGFYLVEENNVVRYSGGGGYMGEYTGTLTEDVKYIGRSPNNPLPTPDLTKITHVLFEYGGELLLVENPLYKGDN